MTSETEKKALVLVNEVRDAGRNCPTTLYEMRSDYTFKALCRAIEQHEAFRQEVSDAIDSSILTPETETHLSRFIIAKPDPVKSLFDYLESTENFYPPEFEGDIRAALAARGLKIVEVGHD